MYKIKVLLISLFLVTISFSFIGCSGGEADYAFDDIEGVNSIHFLSANYIHVDQNEIEIVELQVRSTSSVIFEIIGGTDEQLFDVNVTTGKLTYAENISGVKLYTDDPNRVYVIVVNASNADGKEESKVIRIQIVKDLTKIKPSIDGSIDQTPSVLPALNQIIITITAHSASSTAITYTLSGADKQTFNIDVDGNLYFSRIPSFIPAEDADKNNIYEVTVNVSDQYQTSSIDIHVSIAKDSDLVKPSISTQENLDYVENSTAVMPINATSGVTGYSVTYHISNGVDAGRFKIDNNGALRFKVSPDYEFPTDDNGDNIYDVEVTTVDTSAYANQSSKLFHIRVAGVNEGIPGFGSSYVSLKDDASNEIGTLDLVSERHYTMVFNTEAINHNDTVTLTLAPFDRDDWSSSKNKYDANIFTIDNEKLSINVPKISSGIFGSTRYKTYYVRVIATDEHSNSAYGLLEIRGRSN